MPIMPYIAIPGRSFLRDIIDWYHSTSSVTNHNCLTIIDHKDQVLTQIHAAENKRSSIHLFHRQCLTVGDDPSYRSHPVVHRLHTPFRSLAI